MTQLSNSNINAVADLKPGYTLGAADVALLQEMARRLLASEAQEPVAEVVSKFGDPEAFGERELKVLENIQKMPYGTKLYAAPQPVAVPDCFLNAVSALESLYRNGQKQSWHERYTKDMAYASGVLIACRAAMLNAEPVSQPYKLPDDTKRMDWLVSKTVNVREPMVYGSHSLFWSQAITDENDEYHATKLREQIDAAMAEEQAAAPQ